MPDFTSCKRLYDRVYNGANGKKIAIEYQGEPYMLKFPPSGENKLTELSYTNSCISEHIASTIFNMVGIPAQETLLGTFDIGGKTKIVCACKDFTADGSRLFDFCSIKNTVIDSEHGGTGTELSDILDTIEKQQYVEPTLLLEHFWNVFVIDALLGNFDRHNGNWGFLVDEQKQQAELAPIYDCGSCLYPQLDLELMEKVLTDENEINQRIYQFPRAALEENKTKLSYFDYISSLKNPDCNAALKRITKRIDLNAIQNFLETVPELLPLQREFYLTMLTERKEKILDYSMDLLMQQEQKTAPHEIEMQM